MPAPNTIVTTGIVLGRTNFGEADRILTVLTPANGKISLIAKGVRKEKSKLAGGIELFSVSNISYIPPRKEIGTLVSSRLLTHFGEIVKDMKRTNVAYTALTTINSVTQSEPGAEYYQLLVNVLSALNIANANEVLVEAWFYAKLLNLSGRRPNLTTDSKGYSLSEQSLYIFDFEAMSFERQAEGSFSARHIKLLRLLFNEPIDKISSLKGLDEVLLIVQKLLQQLAIDYS